MPPEPNRVPIPGHRIQHAEGSLGKGVDPQGNNYATTRLNQPLAQEGGYGFMQALVNGVRTVVEDIQPTTWFSPGQPIRPQAQETKHRMFDYPSGYNYRIQPRDDEQTSFETLREFGDQYYLMRLAIETRKRQMTKLKWNVRVKGTDIAPGNEEEEDPRLQELRDMFDMPDRQHNFQTWTKMLFEDKMVVDAASILPRRNLAGKIVFFELIDGTTIKRVIDKDGRTPLPPDPAYQQVLHGIPANNLTMDDLFYMVSNPRTHKLYGFSVVEQVILIVNIALRREVSRLQYYTEGTIPDAIAKLPEGWTTEDITIFEKWWSGLLEGNTAQRRKMKFLPSGTEITVLKEGALKDDFDEWLARIIMFSVGLSPANFIKIINRATAETEYEAAKEEGTEPDMVWMKGVMDALIQRPAGMGYMDIEFFWEEDQQADRRATVEANSLAVRGGQLSLDEVRLKDGREPYGIGPMIETSVGFILIEDIKTYIETGEPVVPIGAPPGGPVQELPFGLMAKNLARANSLAKQAKKKDS